MLPLMVLLWQLLLNALATTTSTPTGGGLRWVRVNLPQYRRPGELAQLQCDYDLGNDTLYAVKWYKGNEEFYRFVPKERPPATSHRVDGVHVDLGLSDSHKVVLRAVGLRSSGLYRCEVSAEAPSFASAQSEARMAIVSLPREDPRISGAAAAYHIGDEVRLNCTAAKSYPAATLTWYINEQQVTSTNALVSYTPVQHRHGLLTSVRGLRFQLDTRHLHADGYVRVKCEASIAASMYDTREALLLVGSYGHRPQQHTQLTTLLVLLNVLGIAAVM